MSDETNRPCPATRRQFCVSACHAATAVALGSVLQSCGGGSSAGPGNGGGTAAPPLTVVNGAVAGGAVTVFVDGGSPLAPVGGAALVRSTLGDFLVAHTAQDTFTALTAICTHEACTITGFRSPTYVCPCHGSQYSTAGQVLSGPATRSLRTFPAQLTGTTLAITV
jgi:cytochrome b6-f complex iron-sulfur subunit